MSWLDALGWGGSALLVFSLLQARVLRLRALNLVACVMLTVFNAVLAVWPMVAMNIVLAAINLWFIVRLLRDSHDGSAYEVLEVPEDDTYLQHFLRVEGEQIANTFPSYAGVVPSETRRAFLVQKGMETVGVVVVDDRGDGTAQVELDYVTERYRDFTPGEFVYRRSGLFSAHGWRRVVTPPGMVGAYYDRLGFRRSGESWVLDVTPAVDGGASARS